MRFSVTEAARKFPAGIALIVDGEPVSYAQLVSLLPTTSEDPGSRRPRAIVAHPTLAALRELYACFEEGIPVVPLSPKLTPSQRADLAAAISGFQPTIDDTEESALAIVFTSGSSGQPKAVELSRRAFQASAEASAASLGWREDDRWLLGLSFAHIGGLSILTRCLLAGTTVVVRTAAQFSPRQTADTIDRDRVTLASLVPTQLRQLLDLAPAWEPPAHLRAVLLGGAAADPSLVTEARARGWPLLLTYGMTETCSQIATQRPEAFPLEGEGNRVGLPLLPDFDLRIFDGVIQVRSRTLLTRYQPPSVHASPITPDGWLVTNDFGRLDSGSRLEVLGRTDEIIVTGGEKVAPLEVERALAGIRGLRAICIFGIPDATWGQLVAAAVVPAGPVELAPFREAIARLPSHQRPRLLAILDALPLTASGKLDRRALAALNPSGLTPIRF